MAVRVVLAMGVAALLGACAQRPLQQADEPVAPAASVTASAPEPAPEPAQVAGWRHMELPGKAATQYREVQQDGRAALEARSSSSASLLRQSVMLLPGTLGRIRFSWKVPYLVPQADLSSREHDDAVVRVMLSFDGDRSRLSTRDRLLSELSLVMTGEPMPYATMMYVWCPNRPVGTVLLSPRTDRIRKLVVESGERRLGRWLDYERDIRADFRAVFGEEPGALIGVGLMTDSDNTHSEMRAWYGAVQIDGLQLANGR